MRSALAGVGTAVGVVLGLALLGGTVFLVALDMEWIELPPPDPAVEAARIRATDLLHETRADPVNPVLHALLAEARLAAKDHGASLRDAKKAIRLSEQALALDEDRGHAHFARGVAMTVIARLVLIGEASSSGADPVDSGTEGRKLLYLATEDFSQAIEKSPLDPTLYWRLARCYVFGDIYTVGRQGERWAARHMLREGVAHAERLMTELPTAGGPYVMRVLLDLAPAAERSNADAVADLTKAIALQPDVASWYQLRASFLDNCGQEDRAAEDRARALALWDAQIAARESSD